MKKEIHAPHHLAIILDGNGRWAKKYKQPRSFGHYHGGRNVFKIAHKAFQLGVKKLTIYAFSTENWKRPKEEIDYLMQKPVDLYHEYKSRIDDIYYKVTFKGRKDRLPKNLIEVIDEIEAITSKHHDHELCVALDYGSYDEIINAVNQLELPINKRSLESKLLIKEPVDLLIRTSGEMRLSNFLLWQASYAEFYFTKKHWPAFKEKDLIKAFKDFNKRQRRFGGLS